jgi:hypothetical protein
MIRHSLIWLPATAALGSLSSGGMGIIAAAPQSSAI